MLTSDSKRRFYLRSESYLVRGSLTTRYQVYTGICGRFFRASFMVYRGAKARRPDAARPPALPHRTPPPLPPPAPPEVTRQTHARSLPRHTHTTNSAVRPPSPPFPPHLPMIHMEGEGYESRMALMSFPRVYTYQYSRICP